jgi:protein phosphatase 2C family protein 2/3
MFDHTDEDKDLESQVRKGAPPDEPARSEREGTPGPQPNRVGGADTDNGVSGSQGLFESPRILASPSPTMNERSLSSSSADKPPPS